MLNRNGNVYRRDYRMSVFCSVLFSPVLYKKLKNVDVDNVGYARIVTIVTFLQRTVSGKGKYIGVLWRLVNIHKSSYWNTDWEVRLVCLQISIKQWEFIAQSFGKNLLQQIQAFFPFLFFVNFKCLLIYYFIITSFSLALPLPHLFCLMFTLS